MAETLGEIPKWFEMLVSRCDRFEFRYKEPSFQFMYAFKPDSAFFPCPVSAGEVWFLLTPDTLECHLAVYSETLGNFVEAEIFELTTCRDFSDRLSSLISRAIEEFERLEKLKQPVRDEADSSDRAKLD